MHTIKLQVQDNIYDIKKLHYDDYITDSNNFENGNILKASKLIVRKTFVVSKEAVLKKYGTLKKESFEKYHDSFCKYFSCQEEPR